MRVFKPKYRARDGDLREAAKWYVEIQDHHEAPRRIPGFVSKAATEELGRSLEKLVAYHRATGGQTDPALRRWLDELPDRIRTKLVQLGLLSSERVAAKKPLTVHLEEFRAALKGAGNTGGTLTWCTGGRSGS